MSSPQNHPDTPAFTALLDAYTRWQHFEQISAQDTLCLSNVPGHDEYARVPVPTSASLAFIMTCPYIDVPDLPKDERNCPVCFDPYHHLSDRVRDDEAKVAQRLPCGHYLCNHCLCKWLDPFEESNNNTCPFDRSVLFPQLPHFLDTEGIQGRVDLVDWLNGARGRHPVGAERDRTAGVKAMLVERRLEEAIEELELDRCKADSLMQSGISACEMDAAGLFAHRRELLLFERRLTMVGAIAHSMEERMRLSMLRARLQRMTERQARDLGTVQGMWDAMNELGGGEIARGKRR